MSLRRKSGGVGGLVGGFCGIDVVSGDELRELLDLDIPFLSFVDRCTASLSTAWWKWCAITARRSSIIVAMIMDEGVLKSVVVGQRHGENL